MFCSLKFACHPDLSDNRVENMIKTLLLILLVGVPEAGGVLFLTGASSLEELDESTMERFESLRLHPVPINCCSRSRLLSCGLFTRFQVASLLDYRSRSGDVLSFTELAAVDGFGERYADALREFVSLEGSAANPSSRRFRQDMMVRGAFRKPEESLEYSAGVKYHAEYGGRVEFNWSDRTTYSSPEPGFGTINLTCFGKRLPGKVILGDYNARFGQGLLFWSGFSMSGVSSAGALARNGTGLSASRSFSSSLHGIAADMSAGKYMFSLAYDRGRRVLTNVSREGKVWQVGLTGVWNRDHPAFSADWRVGFRGGATYGEIAVDGGTAAVVAGAFVIPRYGSMLAALVRAYPESYVGTSAGAVRSGSKVSDEYGASLAAQNEWGLITLDAAWHPSKETAYGKVLAQFKREWKLSAVSVCPALRLSGRASGKTGGSKASLRGDVRADLNVTCGPWSVSGRFNAVGSVGWGWLWYAEAGYRAAGEKPVGISAYLRGEQYRIDNWDDRIYVYERDAPGNFNVPAYYGRGWNLSLVVAAKYRKHSLHLRFSTLKKELKIQYSLSL